jgi:hypothetical protein
VCFLVFEALLFQWPFQCFEAILRENGVIIESSFGRSCNPQFKAFNLKSSFRFKSSAFHFIVEKYFSWAVKKKMMMAMMLAPFVGHLVGPWYTSHVWRRPIVRKAARDSEQLGFSGFS